MFCLFAWQTTYQPHTESKNNFKRRWIRPFGSDQKNSINHNKDSQHHQKQANNNKTVCNEWFHLSDTCLNRKSAIENRKLKKMPHLRPLRLQIPLVVRIGFHANRHLLGDFQSVAFQPDDFFGIVR